MSGGHWNYINDTACNEIFPWHMHAEYGEKGFKQSMTARKANPLEDKQISELCWDMFCLLHSYDWYISGDTCEDTYRKDLKYFKDKWLKINEKDLMRREIDLAIEEVRNDLYKSLILEVQTNEPT